MNKEKKPSTILREVFGFQTFRPTQKEIIDDILTGHDCLAVLPTGAGKSLTFQIPALIKNGVTFVVSPLVSLMKDQVDHLNRLGIPASYINSSLPFPDLRRTLAMVANNKFKLVYIAPERINTRSFKFVYQHLLKKNLVSLLAVDEAHCLSQWGHDFRPSYRQIKELRQSNNVPILAVTATATQQVRDDIVRELKFSDTAKTHTGSLDRPNLKYSIQQVLKKEDSLLKFLKSRQNDKGIIFCATRKSVDLVSNLCKKLCKSTSKYHAGLQDNERKKVQEDFIEGKIRWIVATSAFGMGVNLPDLRFIVHYEMPGSIEQYMQETGRAGRDGLNSECLVLYGLSDRKIHEFFISNSQPEPFVVKHLIDFFQTQEYPLNLSDKQLREQVSAVEEHLHGRNLLRYLQILEDISLITWVNDINNQRSYSLNTNYDSIPTSLNLLELKSSEAKRKLDLMENFCLQESCLRKSLQEYFDTEFTDCDNCSHCLNEFKETVDTVGPVAQQIYAALKTHPMRYGISTIAELLCGGRSQSLFDRNLHDCDHYGTLSEYSQTEIRGLITRLVHKGEIFRSNDEFPKIGLPRY